MQGHDERIRPDQGSHGGSGFEYLPGLDAEENDVHGPHLRRVVRCVTRLSDDLTLGSFDPQALAANRLQMFSARDEDDLFSGPRELRAEVTACSACPEDRNAHGDP